MWKTPVPDEKQPSLQRIQQEEGCCQTIGLSCWVLMMWSSLLCRPNLPSILLKQSRIASLTMVTPAMLLLPSVALRIWSSSPLLLVPISVTPLCVSCSLICALLRGLVSFLHMALPQRNREIPCCFCRNCLTRSLPSHPLCTLKSIWPLNVLDVKEARLLLSLLLFFVFQPLSRIPVLSKICWLNISGIQILNLR